MVLAAILGCVVLVLVAAIVAISLHLRRLSAAEKWAGFGQDWAYLSLLMAYAALACAAVGGCVAVWDVLGRVTP